MERFSEVEALDTPIAERREPELDTELLDLARREVTTVDVRMWWADLVLRGFTPWPRVSAVVNAWKVLPWLLEALRSMDWEALPRRERERLAQLRVCLEEASARSRGDADGPYDDEEDLYEDEEGWGPGPDRELLEWLRQRS